MTWHTDNATLPTYAYIAACGHESSFYSRSERLSKKRLPAMQQLPCKDCQHASADDAAEAYAAELGLPGLDGSERQNSWANRIRHTYLLGWEQSRRTFTPADADALFTIVAIEDALQSQASAKWWIDHELARHGIDDIARAVLPWPCWATADATPSSVTTADTDVVTPRPIYCPLEGCRVEVSAGGIKCAAHAVKRVTPQVTAAVFAIDPPLATDDLFCPHGQPSDEGLCEHPAEHAASIAGELKPVSFTGSSRIDRYEDWPVASSPTLPSFERTRGNRYWPKMAHDQTLASRLASPVPESAPLQKPRYRLTVNGLVPVTPTA